MTDQPTGKTKHTELSLQQIAELQPGLADLMPAVGDRYWVSYYAARGGNWALARYQLRHLVKLFRKGALTRPKHEANLTEYERTSIAPLFDAIESRDFAAFEAAYLRGIEVANQIHRDLGHPDLVWRLPSRPPEQFDLGPQPEAEPKNRER
jgi:hypothetical protein